MVSRCYIDKDGYTYAVSDGISNGEWWMTVKYILTHATMHRVKSPYLPLRKTEAEAQADLDAWAARKHLQEWE